MEEIKILEILTKKAEKYNVSFCGVESNAIIETVNEALSLHNVINWVSVSEKLPLRFDEDYLVCVRNKNKEGGMPIQDIGNFSSDGVWIKQNTWEDVVFWAELPKPPCL